MASSLQRLLAYYESQGLTLELLASSTDEEIDKLTDESDQQLGILRKRALKEYLKAKRKEHALLQSKQKIKESEEEKELKQSTDKISACNLVRMRRDEDEKRKKRITEFMSWTRHTRSIAKHDIINMENQLKKLGSALDICFCIDATGSMSGIINNVKQCIVQVSSCLSATTGMNSRYALVVYRDYCDGGMRHQVWDFTDSSTLASYLQSVVATGGGDDPEDCFGGLRKAINNVNWSSPSKVIIWMGDYPQHGSNYNGGSGDNYPNGDPEGVTSTILFGELQKNKIILVFCKLTNYTDAMINTLKQEVTPYGEGLFLQYNFEGDMEGFLTKTVTATTARTTAFGGVDAGKAKKPFTLTPATWTIDAKWRPEETCSILTFEAYDGGDFNPLLDILLDGPGVNKREATIRITNNPVEEGEMRFAFYSIITEVSSGIFTWRKDRKKGIVKESRFEGAHNCRENLVNQAHIQAVALYLADRFNEKLEEHRIDSNKIIYVPVELLNIPSRPEGKQFYSLEPFIDGSYLKFNNNNGYVNREQEALHPILQTFTHFTYCYSKGLVMVTDVQGVVGRDCYWLTDPAVHTIEPSKILKDPTNLGTSGITAFFNTHNCNICCTRLGLKPPTEMDETAPIEMPKFKPLELVPIDESRWEEYDD